MDQELIEKHKDKLVDLLGKDKRSEVLDLIEELNKTFKSDNIVNEILDIKAQQSALDVRINDGDIREEDKSVKNAAIRKKLRNLKDDMLYLMEHGKEREIIPQPAPEPSPVHAKTNLIDIVILVLTSAVFIVNVVAFAIGILNNPMNLGLMTIATAIMVGIILYLMKYKKDMGKGVYQIK